MKTRKKIFVKRKVAVQPFIILLVMILTVIAIIAFMFLEYSKAEQEKDLNRFVGFESTPVESNGLGSNNSNDQIYGTVGDVIEGVNQTPSTEGQSAIEAAQTQLSEGSDQESDAYLVDTLVPKTISVSDDYLEDALFIGDSILKGFKLYVAPYSDNVLAELNVGLDQIFLNKDVYYPTPNNPATLWESIDDVLPDAEKVYVLIGANGIPGYENEKSMSFYEDLIIKLKDRFADKIVYICSLTPITSELSAERSPDFSKDKIDDFNNKLFTLCYEQDVYFLQVDEDLKDASGYLMSDYDAGDGMHLNKAGHTVLLDYLKTHVVSKEGYAQKVG